MTDAREILGHCRDFAGGEGVRAVRELVALRIEERRAVLERASLDRFQKTQGGIEALRELLRDLEPRQTR
jgi:hypothetical protein